MLFQQRGVIAILWLSATEFHRSATSTRPPWPQPTPTTTLTTKGSRSWINSTRDNREKHYVNIFKSAFNIFWHYQSFAMADKKCHVMLTVEKVKDLGKELPVDESALTDLLNILKHGCNDNFDLCFEVIRVLRNTATKKSSQSFLLNDEANFVSWFLTVSANPIFSSEDEIGRKSRQFLWQFFYNVSVGQELFQTFSWMSDAFKDVFFSTLEHSDDAQLKNVLFGLAYLRVKQENSVFVYLKPLNVY